MTSTVSARTIQLYRAAVIVLLIAVATLATVTGVLLTHHDAPTPTSNGTSVSSFNDGFATSKQDDCQQGDAKACAWLREN